MSIQSPIKVVCGRICEILKSALDGTDIEIPVVSLIHDGVKREMLRTPATAVVVNASVSGQRYEPMIFFSVSLSIRLSVRLCDDVYGRIFYNAHERIWQALFRLTTGDGCEAAGGKNFACDGFQLGGETEPSLDASADGGGVITGGFNATLTGRVLVEQD